MPRYKWLLIAGNVFVLVGLICVFMSSHYYSKVMGEAAKGIAVLAPEENSPAMKEKEHLLQLYNNFFYIGLIVTGLGTVIFICGTIKSP